jgi:hypothetical protein
MAQHPLVSQGLLIYEASQWHSGAPHSVGLTRTCYKPNAQTSTHVISPTHRPLHMLSAQSTALYLKIHNAHHRDTHAPGGIRIRNLSKRATANPPLRPLGHRDRPILHIAQINKNWECKIFWSANGRNQRRAFSKANTRKVLLSIKKGTPWLVDQYQLLKKDFWDQTVRTKYQNRSDKWIGEFKVYMKPIIVVHIGVWTNNFHFD